MPVSVMKHYPEIHIYASPPRYDRVIFKHPDHPERYIDITDWYITGIGWELNVAGMPEARLTLTANVILHEETEGGET